MNNVAIISVFEFSRQIYSEKGKTKRHLTKIAFIILFVSFLKQCCVLEVACMKHHCIIMPLCVVKFCHHSEKIYNCPFGQKSRKAQENGNEASNRFVLTKIDIMKNDDMEMYPQIIYINRKLHSFLHFSTFRNPGWSKSKNPKMAQNDIKN